MADGLFPHLILRNISARERFARPGTGGHKRFPSAVPDRDAHAQMLLRQLRNSQDEASQYVARRADILPESQNGIYLTIEGRQAEPLLTERLERKKKNIELLAVKQEGDRTTATLFVPETARGFFAKTIEDYQTRDEPRALEPEAKNRRLIDGISDIRLAALRDLWIDDADSFPEPAAVIDWEVWLRPSATDRFRVAAMEAGIIFGIHPLVFPEDVALLVVASAEALASLNELTVSISRLARARRMTSFYPTTLEEQARQMDNLLARLHVPEGGRTSLCILDTGVNWQHRLLAPIIAAEDCHAYRDEWNAEDHDGHGTQMAGVCGYGDLAYAIGSAARVSVPYRIESVKIFPPVGSNPHELLGAITAGGLRGPN